MDALFTSRALSTSVPILRSAERFKFQVSNHLFILTRRRLINARTSHNPLPRGDSSVVSSSRLTWSRYNSAWGSHISVEGTARQGMETRVTRGDGF